MIGSGVGAVKRNSLPASPTLRCQTELAVSNTLMQSIGQTGMHSPQSVQCSGSTRNASSPGEMHFSGQFSAQIPQETHSSSMK